MVIIMEVDSHCNTNTKTSSEKCENNASTDQSKIVECNESTVVKPEFESSLEEEMLNHLANNRVAHFKSQQVGDPELDFNQKRKIAQDILSTNPSQFLARFGHYILEQHLDYFINIKVEKDWCYEVDFHVKQLKRFHCKAKNQVDIKNRRFEALKKLVTEGSYFSETEMKKRNPLLYDQLVGRYLSVEEVEERERETMNSISSFVSLMLAKIERDEVNCLRQRQIDDEDGAIEEVDTSEEEEEESSSESESEEDMDDIDREEETGKREAARLHLKRRKVSDKEKNLLREEFVSNMYNSFLEGRDIDFDYSQVDRNPEFENLAVRTQDEEEKYFDSETPEFVGSAGEEEEEDELDKYMKNLKPDATPSDLANEMVNL